MTTVEANAVEYKSEAFETVTFKRFKLTAVCLSGAMLCSVFTGCKQVSEHSASAWEYVTSSWNEWRGDSKKGGSETTLASLQKSAEENISSLGAAAREGAVSIVKDGTKEALREVTQGTQTAVDAVARQTRGATDNAGKNAVTFEKSARQYVYHYLPKDIPRSEEEAREVLFSSSGGIFKDFAAWFRGLSNRNSSANRTTRIVRERSATSNSGGGNRRASVRSIEGRKRPQ